MGSRGQRIRIGAMNWGKVGVLKKECSQGGSRFEKSGGLVPARESGGVIWRHRQKGPMGGPGPRKKKGSQQGRCKSEGGKILVGLTPSLLISHTQPDERRRLRKG